MLIRLDRQGSKPLKNKKLIGFSVCNPKNYCDSITIVFDYRNTITIVISLSQYYRDSIFGPNSHPYTT